MDLRNHPLIVEFIDKLREEDDTIYKRTQTMRTTPEEHGKQRAVCHVEMELKTKIRIFEKNELETGWQDAFLQYLCQPIRIEALPLTRADTAYYLYLPALAAELKYIFSCIFGEASPSEVIE